jgi:hypothetical protein
MRTRPKRALYVGTVLAALLALAGVVAAGAGCELLVHLDPALVDAGEPDALAADEEIEEASPMPEAGQQDAAPQEAATTEGGGDSSAADSGGDASEASASDSGGEVSSGDSGSD